ncbi:hypothetical protein EDB83DRAFT_2385048, partial [Lactarius deliciosus]
MSPASDRRGTLAVLLACVSIVFVVYAVARRFGTEEKHGRLPYSPESPRHSFRARGPADIMKSYHTLCCPYSGSQSKAIMIS